MLMDNIKIGNFIRECRKNKQMTQQQLADKIFVEAKTISKWETGKGLPDVSIMKLLCKELDITINELFLGEHISDDSKTEELEKLIIQAYEKEAKTNKKNVIGEILIGISLILFLLLVVVIVAYVDMKGYLKIIIIIAVLIFFLLGGAGIVILDANIGYYECAYCHERFVPTMKEYVWALHTPTKRKLVCPKCGEKTWCSKKLSQNKKSNIK